MFSAGQGYPCALSSSGTGFGFEFGCTTTAPAPAPSVSVSTPEPAASPKVSDTPPTAVARTSLPFHVYRVQSKSRPLLCAPNQPLTSPFPSPSFPPLFPSSLLLTSPTTEVNRGKCSSPKWYYFHLAGLLRIRRRPSPIVRLSHD